MKELGQSLKTGGTKKHIENRTTLLERCKLRSPPLSPPLEAEWCHIRDNFAKKIGKWYGPGVGAVLLEEVRDVIKSLGVHYRHPDNKNSFAARR